MSKIINDYWLDPQWDEKRYKNLRDLISVLQKSYNMRLIMRDETIQSKEVRSILRPPVTYKRLSDTLIKKEL